MAIRVKGGPSQRPGALASQRVASALQWPSPFSLPTEAGDGSGSVYLHGSKGTLHENQEGSYKMWSRLPFYFWHLGNFRKSWKIYMVCHLRRIPSPFQSEPRLPSSCPNTPAFETCMAAKEGADGKPQLAAHCRASGPETLAGLPVQPLSAPCGSRLHSSHSGTLTWDPTGGARDCLGQWTQTSQETGETVPDLESDPRSSKDEDHRTLTVSPFSPSALQQKAERYTLSNDWTNPPWTHLHPHIHRIL